MAEDNEGRLSRWSRRKRQEQTARRGGAAPVAGVDQRPVPAATGDGAGTPAAEDEEAVRNLPPVEGLDKDSDYAPFLANAVPEKLARAALRKLWSSDPAFNIRDGLDDYDEDFTIVEAIKDVLADRVAKADGAEEPKDGEAAEAAGEDAEDAAEDVEDAEDIGEGDDEAAAEVAADEATDGEAPRRGARRGGSAKKRG